MANEVETLIFKAQTSDLKKAERDLDSLEKKHDEVGQATDEGGGKQRTFGKILASNKGKILAVTAALTGLALVINRGLKAVEETGANFSILNARLVTATGSTQAAAQAFKELNAFALETPFTLDEAVNGFALLKNLGLEPSRASMTSFANTSAAMGKSLEQMIEAVADATTFEFERLKEFGIKTKQEGDTVKFTFRGITTEVGKNAREVKEFLENIGNTAFAGAAIEQTKTLAGSVSNLHQGFDLLKIAAGEVAGANDVFAKSNNDLATTISDPEFQEGVASLTRQFAEIKASAIAMAAATTSFIVDIFTTTELEQVTHIQNLQTRLDGLSKQTGGAANRLKKQIKEAKKALEEIQGRKGTTGDEITGDGDGAGGTGLADTVDEDPEVKRIREKLEAKMKLENDFLEFKRSLIPTELEILKEKHMAELEAEEEKATILQDIQERKTKGMLSLEMQLASGIANIAKKLLGDSKAAAIVGVGIDAAMAAAKVMAQGAVQAQGIRTTYAQLAAASANPALIKVGEGLAIKSLAVTKALAMKTAAIQFGLGAANVAIGGGGGGGGVGGGTSGATATQTTQQEPLTEIPTIAPTQTINVSIDGSIDPSGARRIVEALNDAVSDGIEINALVS